MLSYTDPAVTLDEAASYFTSGDGWSGDAGAILRGQRFVASTYNHRWLVQFDNDGAPDAVKYAILEAARREAATPGSLSPDYQAPQAIKSERVDVLSVEYADPVKVAGLPSLLDGMLAGLANGSTARTQTAFVERA